MHLAKINEDKYKSIILVKNNETKTVDDFDKEKIINEIKAQGLKTILNVVYVFNNNRGLDVSSIKADRLLTKILENNIILLKA